MVIEILLCGLGSLVSEGHLFFPKARTPTTPRFIYTTQDSDEQCISKDNKSIESWYKLSMWHIASNDYVTQIISHNT